MLVAVSAGLGVVGASTWAATVGARGSAPVGDYQPEYVETWTLTGPDAAERRRDALRRATFTLDGPQMAALEDAALDPLRRELSKTPPSCLFLGGAPSGTSAKFDCVLEGGAVVKVKYGRNPEIHAEAAATRLLRRLGYPADFVTIVPRLRCYGCPRFPFLAMRLQATFALPLIPADPHEEGYTEFEWVAVERKLPAPAIETDAQEGWSWWELDDSVSPRGEVDALRLLAVFLAHWDNKDENQRLVCLDGTPPPAANCARPLAMIQDLGATFGPTKVNLARWRDLPVWQDRATCTVSMQALPFGGASFREMRISEAGRARLAERLAGMTDDEIERLFAVARFPDFQVGTGDEDDLDAWVTAFRHRRDQIANVRCASADT